MRRVLSTIVLYAITLLCGNVYAQTENDQLLVFRNTGEVNLLYSNEIDSVVCSVYDKDSVAHDEFVTQVFYTPDTTLVVPIAEIDSVAFGSRNIVEYKDNVRLLSAKDISYIIRYDGSVIYYRTDTPADILPSVGEKLFYGEMDDVFPIGLCALVTSVDKTADAIKVSVTDIDISEVYEKFFYAGRIQSEPVHMSSNNRSTRSSHTIEIPCNLSFGDYGGLSVSGRVTLNTDCVVYPLRHYYHANIEVNTGFGLNVNAHITEPKSISFEDEFPPIHFPNFAGIIHPQISIGAFADINAELAFNYSMQRSNSHRWEWTRKDGVDSFIDHGVNDTSSPEDKAQIDITCNGELFFGPMVIIELNTLLSTVGVRGKMKFGPSVQGEVGLGLIQSLSEEHDPELYSKAEIGISAKLNFGVYTFTRNIFTGAENEFLILNSPHKWEHRTFSLFPDFQMTRAVEMDRNNSNVSISTATKSGNEIIRDVETGFRIEDETTDEVLSVAFVDTIVAETDSMQGVSAEFMIPNTSYNAEQTIARPVFKYAGHTILADKARVLNDNHFQPILATMADGVNYFVTGYPFVGSTVIGDTYYNIGNYVPVVKYDKDFGQSPSIITGIYITKEEESTILGTWKGTYNSQALSITFRSDSTGVYEQGVATPFTYKLNYPQSGDISLSLSDSATKTFVLYSLTDNEMVLKPKDEKVYINFTKQ